MNTTPDAYDVAIIGGGAAGLAAAQALGRSRRSVVVIDANEPRNAPAEGVHNFLTRDGVPPRELLALGRAEAEGYGVRFRDTRAVATHRDDAGFRIELEEGRPIVSRRLILASGIMDKLPDVEGLAPTGARTRCTAPTATAGKSRTGTSPCSIASSLSTKP